LAIFLAAISARRLGETKPKKDEQNVGGRNVRFMKYKESQLSDDQQLDPRCHEVDYLITPALGGGDDLRNLWPHSYSATIWNAAIRDARESHLRELVCGGNLDLAEAQREIAANWIVAYKKYFRTDVPLSEHRRERE
jgi:hypothetical protein